MFYEVLEYVSYIFDSTVSLTLKSGHGKSSGYLLNDLLLLHLAPSIYFIHKILTSVLVSIIRSNGIWKFSIVIPQRDEYVFIYEAFKYKFCVIK